MAGVVMNDPKEIHRNGVPPPVVVEQVLADDVVVYGDDGVQRKAMTSNPDSGSRIPKFPEPPHVAPYRLEPGRARVLEIHYTANSFVAPERVLFKYRLDGYDKDWRWDEGNRRVAFYTSLRPGRYTFHVSAGNNHRVWDGQGDARAVHVAPHSSPALWF